MRSRIQSTVTALVMLIAVMACDPSRWFSPNTRVTGDLFAARVKWGAHGFSRYEFTMEVGGCECSFISPVRVTVTNGVIDGVYRIGSSTALPQGEWAEYRSVEGLFSTADDAINRNAWAVHGDYDPVRDFPRELYIDWNGETVDDEIRYRISDVRAR